MEAQYEIAPGLANDPLLTSVPLPYRQEFYPNGFPARVASNSPLVLAAADESWGGLHPRFATDPLDLRCLVTESASKRVPPPRVVRAQHNLCVSVGDRENFSVCDLSAGLGAAWVTQAAAAATEHFRYCVLEAMATVLLEALHVVDLHAAAVALQECGVLLAGDSGAGKSSLAYACARRGWTYCSDDASSLLRRGTGRSVLGNARIFRFRETAAELFPEFGGMAASRRTHGKPTVEVRTAALPGIRTTLECRVDYIVFLNRRDARPGPARLSPVSPGEALARLYFDPWPGDLPSRQERQAAVQRLAGAEAYEMRYREMDTAVDCLERLVLGGSK